MGGSRPNWATIHTWRKMKERGTEDATGKEERHPGAALLERATAGRSEKLRLYLEYSTHRPRLGEEIERTLNRLQLQRSGREKWLREVLDACQPD